ncbi:MAG: insulinase family protein [Alphaproteobacteria bacterium]|nr:insulinase family protein [Alphaproteobacteria bacterium]
MQFLKIIAILVFVLLLPVPAEAKDFNAETFTLENGLQVVVIPNHRAPVVTHMIWYKFGGGDEYPGKSGIAHFLEHLMFKGTPKVPDGQFSIIVKKLGGNDNAFTTHDYTAYYQNIARQYLGRVMEMEADRMKNLVLAEDEVTSERQVIIEERRQRIDNQPQAKFQEQMASALFVNHPYGIPVIGWLHEMKELTREDALENYSKWYAPNNAVLVVSGDITAAELKPLAEKYYGDLQQSVLPPRSRPRPAPIIARHRIIMEDPRVGPPVLTKLYRAPRGSDALEILTEIFGDSSTSRLYKDLVVDQKLAISAGADYDPISLNDTTLTIYASPTPGTSLPQLEAAMDLEVKKLLEKGVTLEELNAAKSKKKASLTYYLDSLQGPAILFGRAIASGFDMDYLENWNTRVEKLTIDDVNKAANAEFGKDSLPVTGIILPAEKPDSGEKKR